MRTKTVGDNHTLINTQGIRFVEKVDHAYAGGPTSYRLRVTYKGDKMDYTYPDAASRDAQFTALRAAMESPPLVNAGAAPSDQGATESAQRLSSSFIPGSPR